MDADGGGAPGGSYVALPPCPLCMHCGNRVCICWLPGVECDGYCQRKRDCPCEITEQDFELWVFESMPAMRAHGGMTAVCAEGPFWPWEARQAAVAELEQCECGAELVDEVCMRGGIWRTCPESKPEQGGHLDVLIGVL